VCLVLLIIFMVITPLLQVGIGVPIPVTQNPEKHPHDDKQITVSVDNRGVLYLDTDPILPRQLVNQLSDTRLKTPDKRIMIKAHKDLNYGAVKEIMMMCNEAGFTGVGLIVEKLDDKQ
jgi:biopolymer transport protein ExbD